MYTELEQNSHLQTNGKKMNTGVEKIHHTYLGRMQNTLLKFTNWYSLPSEIGDRSLKRLEDGNTFKERMGLDLCCPSL
jgi:hypothetical protein